MKAVSPLTWLLFVAWLSVAACPALAQTSPPPGSLYREFARHNGGNLQWRVTDRKAVEKFERAAEFLPNPSLEIEIADLKDAVRAEAILDRWGRHRGTINKRIRFNDQPWITAAATLALVTGQVTSYSKARAEAVGATANVGIAERAERLIIIAIAALLTGFGVPYVLPFALWLLGALGLVTIGQRMLAVRAQLRPGPGQETHE